VIVFAAIFVDKDIFADPLKLTPVAVTSPVKAIVLPVANVVAVVALVALVAVDALPFNVAVIVPALKLPDPSRATTLLAVFAEVASTAHVVAALPLKLLPVKYDPRDNVFGVLAVMVPEPPRDIDVPFTVTDLLASVTAPELTVKSELLNDATPLALVVAVATEIVPLATSILVPIITPPFTPVVAFGRV
jgi:hypothetical protein